MTLDTITVIHPLSSLSATILSRLTTRLSVSQVEAINNEAESSARKSVRAFTFQAKTLEANKSGIFSPTRLETNSILPLFKRHSDPCSFGRLFLCQQSERTRNTHLYTLVRAPNFSLKRLEGLGVLHLAKLVGEPAEERRGFLGCRAHDFARFVVAAT